METSPLEKEYPVIRKMYDLTMTVTLRVRDFPRDCRFVLGDRMLVNCYNLLDGLIEARYAREKSAILQAQNLCLEKLRFQIRLCLDMKIVSPKQYGQLAEMVNEVGRMIGGWLKSRR
jgi:hypothetical protein